MTGGNVGVFEAIFGRPRANIHRPPVPAVPPFRDNGRVHNPWDMVLNRRAGEMQNNRVTNALEDIFIPPPPLNNRTTAPVNTLRPLRDITTREDTRVPGGISLAQALTNISPPPRENTVERRERIRRQLIRPRTTIETGAEPNPNDNARPQIRPLLLPRRINETPQLRDPANQRLPPLPPLPRPTGEASNYLNELNRNRTSESTLRSVLRRPPPSPGRPGLTLNNWNEVNGNSLPRTRAIHRIPSPVTSHLPSPPTINQPNEARRRRPGVAFDLPNEPEDAPVNHFWSRLGRLGEPDPVTSTSRNANTRPSGPTPYAGVAFPPSPVLSSHARNSMPVPGPSTLHEEDRPMWRRSSPLPEHSLSALLDSLDSSSSGSSDSPPSIPDSLEFIRMNREESDPGSSTSRALPEVQPLSPFSPFLVPSPPSSPESSPLPLPGLDTMDFIPDLTEGMESVQGLSTSNGLGGFRTVPNPSALFLQDPSSSTPTSRTNYPFNSLTSLGGIENSFTSSRGPQNRLRRPYEIVDDREMEPMPSNIHDVSALGPVSQTSLASPQSLVPIAPQPLMSSRVVPPNHRAIRRSPSPSPVMEETLLDVFSGLSRRQIPLSQSPLAPTDDRRRPPATSPYQNLFDRLSSTSVLPTTPNRTLRMTPIEATIEMPNSLPPPLVPTPVPLHRSSIDLERRLPPLPISLDTSS
ncbi:hypothetical protein CPB86DRAFT_497442 [Serendipita vermifera]|nr:hypothetical protein CPB86DRAFT_497442 [Serendipita vermifera]